MYFLAGATSLHRKATPGCGDIAYAQCAPGTLAHDYEGFEQDIPLIPFAMEGKEDSCVPFDGDAELCNSVKVSRNGTSWKRASELQVLDERTYDVTWDDKNGIETYEESHELCQAPSVKFRQ